MPPIVVVGIAWWLRESAVFAYVFDVFAVCCEISASRLGNVFHVLATWCLCRRRDCALFLSRHKLPAKVLNGVFGVTDTAVMPVTKAGALLTRLSKCKWRASRKKVRRRLRWQRLPFVAYHQSELAVHRCPLNF